MFSLVTGSIFFVLAFKELHFFVKDNQLNKIIFYIMFSIWSLYGVAFLLSYENKNSLYNILDLLSKNFYGLFLFGLIYYLSKKNDNKNI
jgi:bacteriorhodopsin